ncbi:MAG: hypothetical protein K5917_05270 [Clostridiales bacterium]|nr:hypothetical protein [Clostridiales bacterium]
MSNNEKFIEFRKKYPRFIYKNYSLKKEENSINVVYDFSIENLCEFHPEITFDIEKLELANNFDSACAEKIIFSLGLVEMISYWKASCCPEIIIECGFIDEEDIIWLKKLFFNGLGEFFFRNEIKTDFNSFVDIKCNGKKFPTSDEFVSKKLNLIPVGGGKDSNVSLELLKENKQNNRCFIINPRGTTLECAKVAGYSDAEIVKVKRTIDKELLSLNAQGFLNGHTPFSAIVAFIALYCSYLIGSENIILSNESSANEGNVEGLNVNHQYSKSFEFEQDFNSFVKKNITSKIVYFSLLRPFSELQIAKQFSAFEKYHRVFKSCNLGSKTDSWCADCPKCLFVYSILIPFIDEKTLIEVFGKNMLDNPKLKDTFDGLVGFTPVKPFECVGTVDEINLSLSLAVKKFEKENKKLPFLLDYYSQKADIQKNISDLSILKAYNEENNIPEKFEKYTKEMYRFVSAVD